MQRRKTSKTTSPAISEIDPQKVRQVYDWILAGASHAQIREAWAAKYPGEDSQPAILAAFGHFNEAMAPDLARAWCLEATRYLYARMVEIGDFANALKALKEIRSITEKTTAKTPKAAEALDLEAL